MTTSRQPRPSIAALWVLVAIAAAVFGVLAMGSIGQSVASASSSESTTGEMIWRITDERC